MMKKVLFIALCMILTLSANAQYTKFQTDDQVTSTQKKEKKSKDKTSQKDDSADSKTSKGSKKVPVMKIDEKYRAGSCPVVDGKVQWEKTISCPGLTAQQIYDKAIAFLVPYCKEKDKDPNSQIAIVNKQNHEIGARIKEYVVFTNTALSLDRAMMGYTLCLYCSNGSCKVVMKDMSYKYENNSFPAEEMLLDKNALNKTQTDFHKGGYKKFRTKTIDAKDTLFKRLADAIKTIRS